MKRGVSGTDCAGLRDCAFKKTAKLYLVILHSISLRLVVSQDLSLFSAIERESNQYAVKKYFFRS